MSSSGRKIHLGSSRQLRSSCAKRICLEPADTQETTIDKLCDDVMVEIFGYLSAAELKSAALVCMHWNEVIGSSAVTMKKFKLNLKENELLGRQFRSIRNHQNIELEMLAMRDGPPSDQKALESLGRSFELSQVKYFKIFTHNPAKDPKDAFACFGTPWKTFSIDAMKLTSALKRMKLLQELCIECPAGFRGSFTSTVELPKLTKLAVKSPDTSIFQWLSASNVTKIDVIHKASRTTVSAEHLVSFLKLCKQITTLKLNSSHVHDLFGDGKWKDFNLKLSELDIDANRDGGPDATSLRKFLISQAPSLTSLMMTHFVGYSESARDSVAETLSHLKHLKILSLHCGFGPDSTFLMQLPELEQLTLYTASDINTIARFNRKLTFLKVYSVVRNSLDAGLEFSELKHLYVGLDRSSNFFKVITSSPKLETIELKLTRCNVDELVEYDQSCEEIIKVVLRLPNLKHLKLRYVDRYWDIRHLQKAFDTILSHYGNLKSLSLSKKYGPVSRSVEFLFPENRLDFNIDEQKKRISKTFSHNFSITLMKLKYNEDDHQQSSLS